MSAYAVDVIAETFVEQLTENQRTGLERACKARGASIDWERGWVTLRGRYLNGLCADLPLPSGLHLTRAGVSEPAAPGSTIFRVGVL